MYTGTCSNYLLVDRIALSSLSITSPLHVYSAISLFAFLLTFDFILSHPISSVCSPQIAACNIIAKMQMIFLLSCLSFLPLPLLSLASPAPAQPANTKLSDSECSAVNSIITAHNLQSTATPFCSSFLSIPADTVTASQSILVTTTVPGSTKTVTVTEVKQTTR